jgi:hypothetical protein
MAELSVMVETVLRATEHALGASTIEPVTRTPETVRSLLRAGEDAIGYEILCENLYEDDIAVERRLLLQLRDAAQKAGADPKHVDPLLS